MRAPGSGKGQEGKCTEKGIEADEAKEASHWSLAPVEDSMKEWSSMEEHGGFLGGVCEDTLGGVPPGGARVARRID